MKLWEPGKDPADKPTRYAKERLADAEARLEIWREREAHAVEQRQLWEQRVRGYRHRLGITVEEPVSG
jgi:hypothetical protein